MATNPDAHVLLDDLLNIMKQISTTSSAFDHKNEIAKINTTLTFGKKESYHTINQCIPNMFNPRSTNIPSSTNQTDSRTLALYFLVITVVNLGIGHQISQLRKKQMKSDPRNINNQQMFPV
ncbi:hypothetical protein O181_107204 [Austropuccinia psidii MF-1]|uniref:Uncharacterized protein n=1 Tax=Austropuccinia psidii MF-1 TaxID=1389203 RepID=A0A9Q3JTL0_9BASI|nr:hypothetical protein [Austropuccinia psidii MF-1]